MRTFRIAVIAALVMATPPAAHGGAAAYRVVAQSGDTAPSTNTTKPTTRPATEGPGPIGPDSGGAQEVGGAPIDTTITGGSRVPNAPVAQAHELPPDPSQTTAGAR